MSAWGEFRVAWRYNTPICQMTPRSRWLGFAMVAVFLLAVGVLVWATW